MRVLLVRHTAAEVAPGLCYGRRDLALSAEGEIAAARLARSLQEAAIARVYTSPARRCRALAEAVSRAPCPDPRLQELDFGAWEGRTWEAIGRAALDRWAADPAGFAPPGGESGAAFHHRVGAFARDVLRRGEDAVVITHGGPLRLLPALLRGEAGDLLAPAPALGAVIELQLELASAVNTAPSTTTAHPPSTSPVKPPT